LQKIPAFYHCEVKLDVPKEGQVCQTKVGHLVPSDLFVAVQGGLLLLLPCWLLDLLGIVGFYRATKLMVLDAEIWSTKVYP